MDDAAYEALMARLNEAYPSQPAYTPADVKLQSGQITQQQGQDPVMLTNPRTLQQGESNPIEFDQSGGVSQLGAMMNAGSLRGMLDMSGQDGMTPGYNAMLTAGGPDGFSASYHRSNEIGGLGDAQNAIMLAKQFGEPNTPSPSLSAGASRSGMSGPITYDLSGSVPLTTGRNPEAPQFRLPSSREEQPMVPLSRRDRERQPSHQEVMGAATAGLSHSPRDHSTSANAGLKFNFADGGHVDAALHLLRQHFDEGGFLSSLSNLFSGPDIMSTGNAPSPGDWGNPEVGSDFFKADKAALALAKQAAAPDDDVTGSIPTRRAPAPVSIAAPAPAPAPDVDIPFSAPDKPYLFSAAQAAPAPDQPLAYTDLAPAAPAQTAIDTAMTAAPKLTGRAAPQPGMTDLTPQQTDYIIRTIAAESSGNPEESQGIANVIMNRINSGRFGANPEAVLFSKNQFEPWSNKSLANYPLKIKPDSDRYQAAAGALDAALQGEDNTGGATYFWGPGSQYARGRNTPSWANKFPDYTDIGATRFHREGRAEGGEVEDYAGGGKAVSKAMKAVSELFDSPGMTQWREKSVIPASKVEDRYYTGTSKDKDFPNFKVEGHGAWFTKDPSVASMYAAENDSKGFKRDGWDMVPVNTADRVIPAYLRAENPFTGPLPESAMADNYKKAQTQWFDQLRAQGHDAWMPESDPNLAVILKNQSDIKSALSNSGDFDLNAPRIDRSSGGETNGDSMPHHDLVAHAIHLLRHHYATDGYVDSNQAMRDAIASIDPEFSQVTANNPNVQIPDAYQQDPDLAGRMWAKSVEAYRNRQEGDPQIRAITPSVRQEIGATIAGEGGGRNYGSELRNRAAQFAVGSSGLDTGMGALDFVPGTSQALAATDIAHDIGQGNYGEAAAGAALPVAMTAAQRFAGPMGRAGARALEIARDYAKPIAGAAGTAAMLSPDEAEAAKLPKIGGILRKAAPDELSGLFDYSRLHEVPKVSQFDLPRNIPARGVPERVNDLFTNQAVKDKMADVISEGQRMGGANWYNTDPLLEKFVQQIGPDAGQKAYRKYMDFVAATSPRSDVGTNIRNASYYYGRDMRGEGMPAVGDRNPQPYGHMAQRLHQMNAERVAGPGWDPLNNPKPASFVENLAGNQEPVTVDTHAFRLPAILGQDPRFLETAYQASKDAPKLNIQKLVMSGDMSMEDALKTPAYWQAQPKANEYAAMERYYKPIGRELGLTPAQTQASAWVGGGKLTGLASDESKPFMRFFDDRIMKTARETGMDPKDVLRDFISGKAPLYNKGGSVEDRALMLVSKQA